MASDTKALQLPPLQTRAGEAGSLHHQVGSADNLNKYQQKL